MVPGTEGLVEKIQMLHNGGATESTLYWAVLETKDKESMALLGRGMRQHVDSILKAGLCYESPRASAYASQLLDSEMWSATTLLAFTNKFQRRVSDLVQVFGAQSAGQHLVVSVLEHHGGALFLHQVDQASVPVQTHDVLLFAELYTCIASLAMHVGCALKEIDTARVQTRSSRKSNFMASWHLSHARQDPDSEFENAPEANAEVLHSGEIENAPEADQREKNAHDFERAADKLRKDAIRTRERISARAISGEGGDGDGAEAEMRVENADEEVAREDDNENGDANERANSVKKLEGLAVVTRTGFGKDYLKQIKSFASSTCAVVRQHVRHLTILAERWCVWDAAVLGLPMPSPRTKNVVLDRGIHAALAAMPGLTTQREALILALGTETIRLPRSWLAWPLFQPNDSALNADVVVSVLTALAVDETTAVLKRVEATSKCLISQIIGFSAMGSSGSGRSDMAITVSSRREAVAILVCEFAPGRDPRTFDGIRILAADVSSKLMEADPAYVNKLLYHPTSAFEPGADFCTARIKEGGVERLYLTWLGFVRVLNRSQFPFARMHCMQAAKTLFVTQLGSADEKEDLILEKFGLKAVQNLLLRISPSKLSAVYLFTIGTLGKLRQSMGIDNDELPDDMLVSKYGRTSDLSRRLGEHWRAYKSLSGSEPTFQKCVLIDESETSDCETYLADYLAKLSVLRLSSRRVVCPRCVRKYCRGFVFRLLPVPIAFARGLSDS
ncbi:hypothetical protein HDU87_001371 [Geranomyces variabilis]|uniref:Uncharacterized protein n=1 Tax=Geranomyces variabilis TaxID=109894 RepID=A0AAD5TMR0_9FUNG|nr:hypothetical protein HDU87_001371 [Geranomyces variabilis]